MITIVKRVDLRCSPERAFVLFTEHASAWWPTERRHTSDAASEIRGAGCEMANHNNACELSR